MAATLVFPVAVSDLLGGCSGRDHDRVYDPYRNDYHTWNQEEAGNYARWETRREHREFNQRNKDEQRKNTGRGGTSATGSIQPAARTTRQRVARSSAAKFLGRAASYAIFFQAPRIAPIRHSPTKG
jgi:hypothetical protein